MHENANLPYDIEAHHNKHSQVDFNTIIEDIPLYQTTDSFYKKIRNATARTKKNGKSDSTKEKIR